MGFPLIGITASLVEENTVCRVRWDYAKAVEKVGGIPVLLPVTQSEETAVKMVEKIDGLLLSGGGDVDPLLFGEEPHLGLGEVCPERDMFEITLAREALKQGKPILGICRGMQVLNVAAGGTLFQDIQSQVKGVFKHYQQSPRWCPSHSVFVRSGTRLLDIVGGQESLRVNSFHHQAVKGIARGFRVAAEAKDGIVEAIEGVDYPKALGVQWHPEYMWERDPFFLCLLKWLVEPSISEVIMM